MKRTQEVETVERSAFDQHIFQARQERLAQEEKRRQKTRAESFFWTFTPETTVGALVGLLRENGAPAQKIDLPTRTDLDVKLTKELPISKRIPAEIKVLQTYLLERAAAKGGHRNYVDAINCVCSALRSAASTCYHEQPHNGASERVLEMRMREAMAAVFTQYNEKGGAYVWLFSTVPSIPDTDSNVELMAKVLRMPISRIKPVSELLPKLGKVHRERERTVAALDTTFHKLLEKFALDEQSLLKRGERYGEIVPRILALNTEFGAYIGLINLSLATYSTWCDHVISEFEGEARTDLGLVRRQIKLYLEGLCVSLQRNQSLQEVRSARVR